MASQLVAWQESEGRKAMEPEVHASPQHAQHHLLLHRGSEKKMTAAPMAAPRLEVIEIRIETMNKTPKAH